MKQEDVDRLFTPFTPNEDQVKRRRLIRIAAKEFARVINDNAPDSADKTAAIRKVREAMTTAHEAIACNE